MPNALDLLGKNNCGTEEAPDEASKIINDVKRGLHYICEPLKLDSDKYKPERTVISIKKFIEDNPLQRILYSEISSFIVGLSESERATVSTNLDTLILHVLKNDVDQDIQKRSITLYDHFQLNLIQLENAKVASDNAIAESIVEEKKKLNKEVKGIEREYITILGIFAAIMLAFIGSFTFSTSVLNNIANVDLCVLLNVALVIGLVFVILITVLIEFLREINDKVSVDSSGKGKLNHASMYTIILLVVLIALCFIGNTLSKAQLPEIIYIGTEVENQRQNERVSDDTTE